MSESIGPITIIYDGHLSEEENREAGEITMMKRLQAKYRSAGWPACETCKRNLAVHYTAVINRDWYMSSPQSVEVTAIMRCEYCHPSRV